MIILENISKTYHTKQGIVEALKETSLTINEGEILGVVGYSGAGKSTLLRCINVLETPTTGRVIVANQNLLSLTAQELRIARKKIGMIFQHFHLLPSRTVAQNIAFPIKDSTLSASEKQKKIDDLLTLVGLTDKKDVYPSTLSGGQKQRVAIARALANDPSVLLCDEATSALDPQTTTSILTLLKEVNQKLGITIVLITHEMSVIKAICDRVAIMDKGKIEEVGNVLDVFTNPQTDIGKEFVFSSTSIEEIYSILLQHPSLSETIKQGYLCKLTYQQTSAHMPLLYEIANQFSVETNIIYGNIELIKNTPIGTLLVILSGKEPTITKALQYLHEQDVKVEVVSNA